MLGDYLRSFWRGVLHNKVATLINVGGLSLGLTVFFALTFYVYREFSWDEQWEDADRIFTVSASQENAAGNAPYLNLGPYVLGTSLLSRHPDAFEAYARVLTTGNAVSIDGTEYPYMQRYHVEPALLDLLQLELVEGSFTEMFANPGAIAITANLAERFFGTASALGKIITFKSPQGTPSNVVGAPVDFMIVAVYTVPEPSTFASMGFIALLDTTAKLPIPNARLDLWDLRLPQAPSGPGGAPVLLEQPLSVYHYFKLREGVDPVALAADLRVFMDANRLQDNGVTRTRYVFRNVQDMHLQPSPLDAGAGDSVQRLWVYAAIGTLVLLISGCNFVMLATLRLVDRMREVGIRKSVGGGGGQLLCQYLLDAFFHTLLAAVLAVLFLGVAFPKLSVMLQFPLQLDLFTAGNLTLSLLLVVLFTLMSSLYPAWMTSQTRPGPLLRNGAGAVVGTGTGLRKLLVCIQFAIVVVLLLASAVVRQQIDYTLTRDRGYSIEHVVTPRMSGVDGLRTPAVLAEFRKVPGVEAAATSGSTPGYVPIGAPTPVRTLAPDGSVREAGLQRASVGAEYFRVMSVRVVAGREFSAEVEGSPVGLPPGVPPGMQQAAGPRNVVLNEAAVRMLGLASPEAAVGQLLEMDASNLVNRQSRKESQRVIGVVADTQFASAMLPPVPTLYSFLSIGIVAVKLEAGADVAAVTEGLKATWDEVLNGTVPFAIQDLGSNAALQLQREQFEARIVTASTLLAIVIALLGLYGLVAATVVKRVKEIGVRKVMGADRTTIVTFFLWQFSKPIIVANVIAWPFGFWAIRQWLTRFPYQLDLSVIVLSGLAASAAALLIAWLTVGVMAARASSVKPVLALRYE